MPKGICPDCEQLVTIMPTGQPIKASTARWWRVAYHPAATTQVGVIVIETACEGIGKLI